MASLFETPAWVAGIYQIEEMDAVLGGAPNLATGAGIDNIPHFELACRTNWLRQLLADAGLGQDTGAAVQNLDTVTASGFYTAPAAAIGSPDQGAPVAVIHLPGSSSNLAYQIAVRLGGSLRIWARRRSGSVWAPWTEMLHAGNTGDAALRDVTQGQADLTPGRVLKVGDFGWGGQSPEVTLPGALNQMRTNQRVRVASGNTAAVGAPAGAGGGICDTYAFSASFASQDYREVTAPWRLWRRSWTGASWSGWTEMLDAGDVTQLPYDATPGRLLKVGAFGMGLSNLPDTRNLDVLPGGGIYASAPGATGAPEAAQTYTVLHIPGLGDGWTQIASPTNLDTMFIRRKPNGAAIMPWRRIWEGVEAASSLGSTGYQVLPSGLIMQWGLTNQSAAGATGSAAIAFPLDFPTACHQVTAQDPNIQIDSGAWAISAYGWTQTGFTLGWQRLAGNLGAPQTITWFAIGV